MKKSLFIVFIFLILFSAFDSVAELKKSKPNPPHALARGFSNLMFGWLEIPRGIIYENSRIPIVGFVVGPIKGAFLTVWREIAGTIDIVALGLTREGLYCDQVPEFVWNAPWISPCGEDIVKVETLNTSSCLIEDFVPEIRAKKKSRIIKVKEIRQGFNPQVIKSSCSSINQETNKNDLNKHKTTALCWKSPVTFSDEKKSKKRSFIQTDSNILVPFNLDTDDEFLKALEQIKHHADNIEHRAQMISNEQ
jgi:putative exosortase-associated protein (TIGR04073 family)